MSSWEHRKSGLIVPRNKLRERMMSFHIPYPGGVVTGNFISFNALANAGNSASFSGLSLGTPATNRSIIVVAMGFSVGAPNSCSVASVIATQVIQENNAGVFSQIYIAAVPIGSTGTIAIGGATSMSVVIAYYAMYGNSSQTPVATGNSGGNPGSATLSCPGGSFAIAGMASLNNPGVSSWTGLTKDMDTTLATSRESSASKSISTAQSLTVQCSQSAGTSPAFATSAWGP